MTEAIRCECSVCEGTGLYVGMQEQEGMAVVCSRCGGSGETEIHYTPFTGRKERPCVEQVIQVNPGITIRPGHAFGGLPYERWMAGESFPRGSEMREHTCPAWWFQGADWTLKPSWDECRTGASVGDVFSTCDHWHKKHQCWARWDKENS